MHIGIIAFKLGFCNSLREWGWSDGTFFCNSSSKETNTLLSIPGLALSKTSNFETRARMSLSLKHASGFFFADCWLTVTPLGLDARIVFRGF